MERTPAGGIVRPDAETLRVALRDGEMFAKWFMGLGLPRQRRDRLHNLIEKVMTFGVTTPREWADREGFPYSTAARQWREVRDVIGDPAAFVRDRLVAYDPKGRGAVTLLTCLVLPEAPAA